MLCTYAAYGQAPTWSYQYKTTSGGLYGNIDTLHKPDLDYFEVDDYFHPRGYNTAGTNTYFGINSAGTVGFHTISGGGGTDCINVEILTGTKTLTNSDCKYQFLDPNGADRIINLPTVGVDLAKVFVIRNTALYTSEYEINVKFGLNDWYILSDNEMYFIYDGTSWYDNYETNVAIGNYNRNNYGESVVVGYSSNNNYNHGVAVGYNTRDNNDYGTGIGAYTTCNGNQYAVALGAKREAKRRGEVSFLSDESTNYKHQETLLHWIGTTSNATETELYLNGVSGQRCGIEENSVVQFHVKAVAKFADETAVASWEYSNTNCGGFIRREGLGNVQIVPVATNIIPSKHVDDGGNWILKISADTANNTLKISVFGNATTTVQWHVVAQLTEILD